MIEDFPIPGWPCTHTPVLLISPVRSQCAGSRPTGSAVCRLRPTGTPVNSAPEATLNGNRPHSWLVVPASRVPAATVAARPPPGTAQPVGVSLIVAGVIAMFRG